MFFFMFERFLLVKLNVVCRTLTGWQIVNDCVQFLHAMRIDVCPLVSGDKLQMNKKKSTHESSSAIENIPEDVGRDDER